jgi:hypothetical protein
LMMGLLLRWWSFGPLSLQKSTVQVFPLTIDSAMYSNIVKWWPKVTWIDRDGLLFTPSNGTIITITHSFSPPACLSQRGQGSSHHFHRADVMVKRFFSPDTLTRQACVESWCHKCSVQGEASTLSSKTCVQELKQRWDKPIEDSFVGSLNLLTKVWFIQYGTVQFASLHLLGHEKHFLLSHNVYVLANDLRKKPCPSQTNEYCTRSFCLLFCHCWRLQSPEIYTYRFLYHYMIPCFPPMPWRHHDQILKSKAEAGHGEHSIPRELEAMQATQSECETSYTSSYQKSRIIFRGFCEFGIVLTRRAIL